MHKRLKEFCTTGPTRKLKAALEMRLRTRLRMIDLGEKMRDMILQCNPVAAVGCSAKFSGFQHVNALTGELHAQP